MITNHNNLNLTQDLNLVTSTKVYSTDNKIKSEIERAMSQDGIYNTHTGSATDKFKSYRR